MAAQMMKEQESKAEATLKQIRKKDDVSAELADMRRTLEEEKMNKGQFTKFNNMWIIKLLSKV